jgi:hypothetical protein
MNEVMTGVIGYFISRSGFFTEIQNNDSSFLARIADVAP